MRAMREGVDQPVITAAACDLTRNARAVDLDLEDHAGIILEMTPEIGFEYDGCRSRQELSARRRVPAHPQSIPEVYVRLARQRLQGSERGGTSPRV